MYINSHAVIFTEINDNGAELAQIYCSNQFEITGQRDLFAVHRMSSQHLAQSTGFFDLPEIEREREMEKLFIFYFIDSNIVL